MRLGILRRLLSRSHPEWVERLPPHLRPDPGQIKRLEALPRRLGVPHDEFHLHIAGHPATTRRVQHHFYADLAREIFRVVLTDDLRVDRAATAELRRQALVGHLGREPGPPRPDRPPVLIHVTEYLDLVQEGGQKALACARCGFVPCPARENYKAHTLRIDRPIRAANPLIGDPKRFIDAEVQFRQFCCPACGGLIENEVCRTDNPLLWDIQLAVE